MFPQHLKYLHSPDIVWHNPCRVYYDFWRKVKEIQKNNPGKSFDDIWSSREMKQNKEIYFSALSAICFREIDQQKDGWWVTKVEQDPPDGLVGAPVTVQDRRVMCVREIEIVEFISGTIEDVIVKKLSNKSYQKDTFLFCYLSPKELGLMDFKSVSKNILSKKLNLEHIYLLATGMIPESVIRKKSFSDEDLIREARKISLIQISPSYQIFTVNPEEACANFLGGKEKAWMRFEGRGKGGTWKEVTESVPSPIKN